MDVDVAAIIQAALNIGKDVIPLLEKLFSSLPW